MQIEIKKRYAVLIFAGLLLLASSIYVYAYVVNPGSTSNPGHSLESIPGLFQGDVDLRQTLSTSFCRKDGVNCPASTTALPAWKDLTNDNDLTHIPADVPPGFMHGYCYSSNAAGCSEYYAIEPCYCAAGAAQFDDPVSTCRVGYMKVQLGSTTVGNYNTCMRDKPTHP